MYEYAEQTIEISLVKEEEIPVMLELMNTIYQELPDKSWFSMDSEENLIRYMSTSGFALKDSGIWKRVGKGNWQQSLWRGRQNLGKKIMENI